MSALTRVNCDGGIGLGKNRKPSGDSTRSERSIPSTAQRSTGPPVLFMSMKKPASNSLKHRKVPFCSGAVLPAIPRAAFM